MVRAKTSMVRICMVSLSLLQVTKPVMILTGQYYYGTCYILICQEKWYV